MWFKNIQFKLVNLSKCGRRQRKREEKERRKREAIIQTGLSWQKKAMWEWERERKFMIVNLLSAYWLCFGGVVYFVPNVFPPPPSV